MTASASFFLFFSFFFGVVFPPTTATWSRHIQSCILWKAILSLHPAGSAVLTCRLLLPSAHAPAAAAESIQSTETASMAAKHVYRQGFLLLLFNFMSAAALERRFSDIKRCADKECSSKSAGFPTIISRGLLWCVFAPSRYYSHKLPLSLDLLPVDICDLDLLLQLLWCCLPVWCPVKTGQANININHVAG